MKKLSRFPKVVDRDSARAFLTWCAKHIGGGFHPDTRFTDYAMNKIGRCMFTKDLAYKLQIELNVTFAILGDKIYDVAMEEYNKAHGEF